MSAEVAVVAMSGRLKLLPVSAVHAETGIPKSTIRRLCATGEIDAVKIGRKWYAKRAALEARVS